MNGFRALNEVRKSIFSTELKDNWDETLENLKTVIKDLKDDGRFEKYLARFSPNWSNPNSHLNQLLFVVNVIRGGCIVIPIFLASGC